MLTASVTLTRDGQTELAVMQGGMTLTGIISSKFGAAMPAAHERTELL
jgi:hypothetical protein